MNQNNKNDRYFNLVKIAAIVAVSDVVVYDSDYLLRDRDGIYGRKKKRQGDEPCL